MKLFAYIPLRLLGFQILGILSWNSLDSQAKFPFAYIIITFGLLSAIYFINRNRVTNNYIFSIAVFIMFYGLGAQSISNSQQKNQLNHYSKFSSFGLQKWRIIILKDLKPGLNSRSYYARVIKVNDKPCKGLIKVSLLQKSSNIKLSIDDQLSFKAKMASVMPPLNPYQFNYKNYLANKQIDFQLFINENEVYITPSSKSSLRGMAFKIRERLNKNLRKNGLKSDELALVNALILGQRHEMSEQLIKSYQDAGIIHILAVSGLHIGIIMLLLNSVLKPLERVKYGRHLKLLIIIGLLWFYAFLAGLSASIIRAVTMFSAVAVAMVGSWQINTYKALIISIFLLLLFNPFYLFDIGFQMSYLAVIAILWVHPLLKNLYKPINRVKKYIWQLITVSLAAQIGVLPLSIYYFHQFPSLFLLANLLIIPWLGFILTSGILVLIGAYFDYLPQFLLTFFNELLGTLNSVVKLMALQDHLVFKYLYLSFIELLLCYLFIFLIILGFKLKRINYIKWGLILIVYIQFSQLSYKVKRQNFKQFIIFQKHRHTLLGFRKGNQMLFTHNINGSLYTEPIVNSYLSNTYVNKNIQEITLDNLFTLGSERIMILDSDKVFNINIYKPSYLLLQQSTTINLDRVLKNNSLKMVIADGSNFSSFITFWQRTCKKYGVPFYNTKQQGAFIIEY